MSRTVFCVKHQIQTEGLAFIPWPGALGKRVFENIGRPAWQIGRASCRERVWRYV